MSRRDATIFFTASLFLAAMAFAQERTPRSSEKDLTPERLLHADPSSLPVIQAPARVYQHPAPMTSVTFRPDSKMLAAGDSTGKVWFWPLGADGLARSLVAHKKAVTAMAYAPDGDELSTGSVDGSVKVWDLKTFKSEVWLERSHKGPVTQVAFTERGGVLLSASRDDSIWVRDMVTGQKRFTYFGHSADVVGFTVNPSETCVISGSADRSLQSWSLEFGEQLDFSSQPGRTFAVSLSPDGKMLASASEGGLIDLRRTDGCTMNTIALRLETGLRRTRLLRFTRDGKYLLSDGAGNQVIRWNVETGQPEMAYGGHQGAITDIALSNDGVWMATSSEDMTVRLWQTGVPPELEAAPSASPLHPPDEIQGSRADLVLVPIGPDP